MTDFKRPIELAGVVVGGMTKLVGRVKHLGVGIAYSGIQLDPLTTGIDGDPKKGLYQRTTQAASSIFSAYDQVFEHQDASATGREYSKAGHAEHGFSRTALQENLVTLRHGAPQELSRCHQVQLGPKFGEKGRR